MNEMISLENVTKTYKDKTVVDKLSLSIGKGEVFALLGANGAGKTTTIKMILGLTDDMNTSLKLESDSYELVREEKDVCEIVRRICVEFYEDITATGKDFDINIPEEPCMASVDEKLFGRVINNLLANANKYNSSGKLIVLNLSSENSEILIEVMDDGEAIDEEFVPKMFDEFARGDKTRKTDGGTGLGLAISRKIMEKHNGSLKYIRAEEMNCFCVRLNAQT